MILRPEDVWPVDPAYEESYKSMVKVGRETAKNLDACIVGIARNAMHALPNTLMLVDAMQREFRDCRMFVYENDSTDGTGEYLEEFRHGRPWFSLKRDHLGGIDSRGFEPERTERLAHCRNQCFEWVLREAGETTWTIVLDLDPEHGFSIDGVFNSIGWLASMAPQPSVTRPGGMASYSLMRGKDVQDGAVKIAHYDSWAARLNWWDDRRNSMGLGWFSLLLLPVGSPPVPMNSAFGGLGVYYTQAYLSGGYSGEDCEHVPHHKRMRTAGYQMYLNPGSRYIAIWR